MQLLSSRGSRAPMRRIPLALTVAAFATACSDLTSPEVDAPVAEATLTTTVVAENPTQGAYLKGLVIFRASAEGLAPWQYRMKWSVDGGYETAMRDAVGADEAWVELSQWKWNGAGPYRITFRAYDGRSRVMGQTSVDFYIGDAPAPPPPAAAIGGNPFTGARFFVEPYSNARQTADLWRASRPQDAAYMDI